VFDSRAHGGEQGRRRRKRLLAMLKKCDTPGIEPYQEIKTLRMNR